MHTTITRNINIQSLNYNYTNEGIGFNNAEEMFMINGQSQ